jgi:hypothetical protein
MQTVYFEISTKKHDKTGEDIWIVKLKEKLNIDEYSKVADFIKRHKGYWSGFVKGFVFKYDVTELLGNGIQVG